MTAKATYRISNPGKCLRVDNHLAGTHRLGAAQAPVPVRGKRGGFEASAYADQCLAQRYFPGKPDCIWVPEFLIFNFGVDGKTYQAVMSLKQEGPPAPQTELLRCDPSTPGPSLSPWSFCYPASSRRVPGKGFFLAHLSVAG